MAIEDLRYIAIEGVIWAGKTSLTARLSQTIGAKAIYEEFEKNPFLEDFYNNGRLEGDKLHLVSGNLYFLQSDKLKAGDFFFSLHCLAR